MYLSCYCKSVHTNALKFSIIFKNQYKMCTNEILQISGKNKTLKGVRSDKA